MAWVLPLVPVAKWYLVVLPDRISTSIAGVSLLAALAVTGTVSLERWHGSANMIGK